jgi:hypothetical protein
MAGLVIQTAVCVAAVGRKKAGQTKLACGWQAIVSRRLAQSWARQRRLCMEHAMQNAMHEAQA